MQNVQLVSGDHRPADHKQQSAYKRQIEVAAIAGWQDERAQNIADAQCFGCHLIVLGRPFARPDQNRNDASNGKEHRTGQEACAHMFDELCAHKCTCRLANNLRATVERGESASRTFGDTVRKYGDCRGNHHIDADLHNGPARYDAGERGAIGGEQITGCGDKATAHDPWGAFAETGARDVAHRTKHNVGDECEYTTNRIHGAENHLGHTDTQFGEALRQEYLRAGSAGCHPNQGEQRKANTEAPFFLCGQRAACVGSQCGCCGSLFIECHDYSFHTKDSGAPCSVFREGARPANQIWNWR